MLFGPEFNHLQHVFALAFLLPLGDLFKYEIILIFLDENLLLQDERFTSRFILQQFKSIFFEDGDIVVKQIIDVFSRLNSSHVKL